MKNYAIMILLVLFIFGCSYRSEDKKAILARVNNYEITQDEFEEEFRESAFGSAADTLESREEFLNALINRKLILQEAEREGLDKEKSFLKMIQRFWEQSLLKTALDKKAKDIASSASVKDEDIEEGYNRMLEEGKTEEPYETMYNQIRREITRLKQSRMMDEWISELYKNSDIKINKGLLQKGGK